jgi:UDP-N-acetylmuramate--alanine ligase
MSKGKVHFIGVGGVGMAGLAQLLKSSGREVSGCDSGNAPRLEWLRREGVEIFDGGHDPSHLEGVEEVVVTPAVRQDEPELAAARAKGIAVHSRGETLARYVSSRETIAVCGSHGKTTTATFIAKLLSALGEDVAWAIGGETGAMPVAKQGAGPLVVEADESDGTLALYRAKTLVVNKCEYDHPDFFKTEKAYFECYETAKRNAGEVIDAELLDLDGWDFPVRGGHNRRNARAAVEVALRRGHAKDAVLSAMRQAFCELPDRRFQKIAEAVYTDYAHHPTEMKCAVGMAREICSGRLRVLFQPHRYSRTRALLKDFPAAFEGADEVILCPTYAAFEDPVEGGDVADLYKVCRESAVSGGACARFHLARSCEEAWTHAALSRREGDLTLLLGAGDIIKLLPWVREGRVLPGRRIWIGAGSNTWKSDLRTNEEYVKSESPAGRPGATLGIPWMAGIPGTIGGWVKMNAGAFGHSISEVLEAVKVDGVWISREECAFAYRSSGIKGEIQDVKLVSGFSAEGNAEDYLARRRRFPAGTWGSFFKNPPGDFAGRLLEAAGAKDLKVGGAYVWEEHANVIVRGENASASDVLALAQLMYRRVRQRFNVELECEVTGITLPDECEACKGSASHPLLRVE